MNAQTNENARYQVILNRYVYWTKIVTLVLLLLLAVILVPRFIMFGIGLFSLVVQMFVADYGYEKGRKFGLWLLLSLILTGGCVVGGVKQYNTLLIASFSYEIPYETIKAFYWITLTLWVQHVFWLSIKAFCNAPKSESEKDIRFDNIEQSA